MLFTVKTILVIKDFGDSRRIPLPHVIFDVGSADEARHAMAGILQTILLAQHTHSKIEIGEPTQYIKGSNAGS